jgi:anaerobic selenocysteine-containing dehydrogenase
MLAKGVSGHESEPTKFFENSAGAIGSAVAAEVAGLGLNIGAARAYALNVPSKTGRQVPSICPYCTVGCAQIIMADDKGRVIDFQGNPDSPINQGTLCPKGAATYQLVVIDQRWTTVKYRAPGSDKYDRMVMILELILIVAAVAVAGRFAAPLLSRQARAMVKHTRYGRKQQEGSWQNAEIDALHRLAAAGVRVPRIFSYVEGVLLMELVADENGKTENYRHLASRLVSGIPGRNKCQA